jgi:hypothetical protein
MKLSWIVAIAIFMSGCATTPFDRFEQAKSVCRAQGKKLAYHTATMQPVACMTDEEFAQLPKTAPAPAPVAAPAMDPLAALMVLQAMPKLPPMPAYQPPQPTNCMSTFAPASAWTTCY